MKILIIGGGNMGRTYAQAFLRARITQPSDLMIQERNQEKIAQLAELGVGILYEDTAQGFQRADLIILAVKPQDAPGLFDTIRPYTEDQQLFLSIMAGVTIERISEGLGVHKIIRAMPNLPAQIGKGMTVYTSSAAVTRIELVMVQNLLSTTGKAVYVEEESAIDAATAISGSGPAYVWYIMDALMAAARQMGFSASEAELLVSQTFNGAVDLYTQNDFSCAEWIERVSSRGGTTEAAMRTYRDKEVHADIMAGAHAAMARAIELGKK